MCSHIRGASCRITCKNSMKMASAKARRSTFTKNATVYRPDKPQLVECRRLQCDKVRLVRRSAGGQVRKLKFVHLNASGLKFFSPYVFFATYVLLIGTGFEDASRRANIKNMQISAFPLLTISLTTLLSKVKKLRAGRIEPCALADSRASASRSRARPLPILVRCRSHRRTARWQRCTFCMRTYNIQNLVFFPQF